MSGHVGFERNDVPIEEGGKRRKKSNSEYSLGESIDLLSEREWRIILDLYKCRCFPQSAVIETYFLDSPEHYYDDYAKADEKLKEELQDKNRKRAVLKTRRTFQRLKLRGLVEASSIIPDAIDMPASKRGRLMGETWYYLSLKGLKIAEKRLEVPDESKLSKNEIDMERAKKEHFWELAKVYLDLRYNWMKNFSDMKQYVDWDWYPSESVWSDDAIMEVRPDAILRIGEQLFFIELDRSTEPIMRSPFQTDQVSIAKKLERYRNVIRLSSNLLIRKAIIAFIIPDAIYSTRLKNIKNAALDSFGENHSVLTGRNIEDILIAYSDLRN